MYAQGEDAPRFRPPLVEQFAQEDAWEDDRRLEPIWYHQFSEWAQIGVISEDAWQRYRSTYVSVRRGDLSPRGGRHQ